MRPSPSPRPHEDHHRALASRTRTRLLDLLRASRDGSDARFLADELGLHVNTVRSHLAVLERAGLASSAPEERRVRGRPRIIYRAVAGEGPGSGEEYRFLATVLASSMVADTPEPGRLAEQAGERWGRRLAERPQPGRDPQRDDRVERAMALLDELGFEPRLDAAAPGRIQLHRCPFRELALDHTEVVCGIHLGILRGALAEAGAPDAELSLSPFVTTTMCVAEVGVG